MVIMAALCGGPHYGVMFSVFMLAHVCLSSKLNTNRRDDVIVYLLESCGRINMLRNRTEIKKHAIFSRDAHTMHAFPWAVGRFGGLVGRMIGST